MKAYTDIEQSKKLVEILSLESADMYWWSSGKRYYIEAMDDGDFNEEEGHIRAWSLAALLDVLPQSIEFKGDKYYLRFMKEYVEYANDEVSITGRCLHTTGNDNLVDACMEMILKLKEKNLL